MMKAHLLKPISAVVILLSTGLVPTVARATEQHVTAHIPTQLPSTLTGTHAVWLLDVPRFNPQLGTLLGITFAHASDFEVGASMQAQGGNFQPPFFIDAYSFDVQSYFELKGPGVDSIQTVGTHDFGTGNYQFQHSHEVQKSGHADLKTAVLYASNAAAGNYVGDGMAQMLFNVGVTSAFPGHAATPGGFTWLSGSTITAAGLAQNSFSSIDITYFYTAAPVPEPATLLTFALGIAAIAAHQRGRKRSS